MCGVCALGVACVLAFGCVCVYVCVCVRLCARVCIHVHMHVCMYECMCSVCDCSFDGVVMCVIDGAYVFVHVYVRVVGAVNCI